MAYQASRNGGDGTRGSNYYNPSQSASMRDSGNGNDNQMSQDERNVKNNANNIRNAADVAMASKNPYAMAAGAVVKGADKITGGKSTEALGKAINNIIPLQSEVIKTYLFAYKPCDELMKLEKYSKYYDWLNSLRKTPYLEIIEGRQEIRTYDGIDFDINNLFVLL